jgi:hypothetical protein
LPSECIWVDRIPLSSSVAETIAAPAPSPKITAVSRPLSVKFIAVDCTSEPIRRILSYISVLIYCSAIDKPYIKPEHWTRMSRAPISLNPIFSWIRQPEPGA